MLRHRRPVDLAASAGVEIDGGLVENELKGQIRPFFLISRTGPPHSRPYAPLMNNQDLGS
jgi:hypothetical protein